MGVVIDCDSHVMEPPDLWLNYLESKYLDRAIRIEEHDGVEQLVIGEKVVLQRVLAGLGGANLDRATLFSGNSKYMDGCPLASYDPSARAKMLDEWGVDKGVLFPTIGILPFPTKDMDLANAYCRAYNTWQQEFFESIPNRVVPIALVNWYDVEEAERELQRCVKAGFRGLFIPPETIDGHRPGTAHFDPLWRICDEANIPGCFHVIVRFEGAAIPFREWHGGAVPLGPTFSFGIGPTGQLIPAMTSVVLDGLLDRYPGVKVVSVEAGCGYAAYLMDRLDEKYHFFDWASSLKMKPSEYIQRNCYFVAEPEERTIGAMLELVGRDHILWGSDYPHIDSRLDARELINGSLKNLSAGLQSRVLGENAQELFALN